MLYIYFARYMRTIRKLYTTQVYRSKISRIPRFIVEEMARQHAMFPLSRKRPVSGSFRALSRAALPIWQACDFPSVATPPSPTLRRSSTLSMSSDLLCDCCKSDHKYLCHRFESFLWSSSGLFRSGIFWVRFTFSPQFIFKSG